jgi:hypothetical protein
VYVAVNLYLNDFSFALGIINYQCQAFNGAAQTADRLCIYILVALECELVSLKERGAIRSPPCNDHDDAGSNFRDKAKKKVINSVE